MPAGGYPVASHRRAKEESAGTRTLANGFVSVKLPLTVGFTKVDHRSEERLGMDVPSVRNFSCCPLDGAFKKHKENLHKPPESQRLLTRTHYGAVDRGGASSVLCDTRVLAAVYCRCLRNRMGLQTARVTSCVFACCKWLKRSVRST